MQQFKNQDFMNTSGPLATDKTSEDRKQPRHKVTANAGIYTLKQGIYLFRYASQKQELMSEDESNLPLVHITPLPDSRENVIFLEKNNAGQTWLKQAGETGVLKIDSDTADILVNIYSSTDRPASGVNLELKLLDGKKDNDEYHSDLPGVIVITHMQNSGNIQFQPGEWSGKLNSRTRLEGFVLESPELGPSPMEYKVVSIDGRETPWINSPTFCGTRGRGLPLSAFAIRLKAPYNQQYDIVYRGSFFEGGQTGVEINGKFCRSPLPNDPMEAIQVTLRLKQKAEPSVEAPVEPLSGFSSFT